MYMSPMFINSPSAPPSCWPWGAELFTEERFEEKTSTAPDQPKPDAPSGGTPGTMSATITIGDEIIEFSGSASTVNGELKEAQETAVKKEADASVAKEPIRTGKKIHTGIIGEKVPEAQLQQNASAASK